MISLSGMGDRSKSNKGLPCELKARTTLIPGGEGSRSQFARRDQAAKIGSCVAAKHCGSSAPDFCLVGCRQAGVESCFVPQRLPR